jgi:hypothetical protein
MLPNQIVAVGEINHGFSIPATLPKTKTVPFMKAPLVGFFAILSFTIA